MRLHRLAFAGLALLLLAGIWSLFGTTPGMDPEAGADAAARSPAEAAAPGLGPSPAETLDRADAADASTLAGEDDWLRAPGPRLRVRVRHLFTRAPIAGAGVWVFDPAHYNPEQAAEALDAADGDWEAIAGGFARFVEADDAGEFSLPQPREWLRLIGRADGLYGEVRRQRSADGDVATLYLEPDRILRVRTVDASGEALPGIPVGLRTGGADWSYWRMRRTTGEDGRASFAHLQTALRVDSPGERIDLTVALPRRDVEPIRFAADEVPEEEQILAIPGSGALRVRLFDADRRPFRAQAQVMLQGAWPGTPNPWGDAEEFEPSAARGSHVLEAVDGEVLFQHLEPGLRLTVAVDFDGTQNWESLECDGPTAAAHVATIEVLQRVTRPYYVARLLAPDGSPLREAEIQVQDRFVNQGYENVNVEDAHTDGEGRLRGTIREDWMEQQPGSQRWIEFLRIGGDGAVTFGARLEGRAGWSAGRNDLGDVRLQELGAIASGVVLDEAGAPLPQAEVTLARRFLRGRNRETWRQLRDARTRTDLEGRFAIVGFLPEGTLRLEARHRDFPMQSAPWLGAEEEHRLQLSAGRFVLGTILRDEDTFDLPLEVQLVSPGAIFGEHARYFAGGPVERNGEFRCDPSEPIPYDLWVLDRTDDRLLAKVSAVTPQALSEPPDPRLDPLDLRGILRRIRVDCRSPDGRIISSMISFGISPGGADEPEDWGTSSSGQFSFLAGEGPQHLWLRSQEYKPEDLDVGSGPLQITLHPGPVARLVLADSGVLEIADRIFVEWYRMEGEDEKDGRWLRLEASETRQQMSIPGEYRARLYFALPGERGSLVWHSFPQREQESPRFQMLDVVGEQVVRLPWSAAEIRAALPRN